MYGLNAVALVFFGCINVLAYRLCKCPEEKRRKAVLLRPYVAGTDRLLICILLDAVAVKQLLPESTWTVALPVYYLAVAAFVLLTSRGFFRRNQKQYRKFAALQTA